MDIKNFFEGKIVFLTGGTGSFGRKLLLSISLKMIFSSKN